MKNCLILGLGSPNGDDQLGWLVVNKLTPILQNMPNFKLLKSGGKHNEWITLYGKYDYIIVIDAVADNQVTGTIIHCPIEKLKTNETLLRSSSHSLNLHESFELAKILTDKIVKTDFIGVCIAQYNPSQSLTPDVKKAIPNVVRKILHLTSDLSVLETVEEI